MLIAAAAIGSLADEPELPVVPKLPDLVRTKNQAFAIPFKVAPSQSADQAAQRVVLEASSDLGVTWSRAGEAAPAAGSIAYRAGVDGEYWFRLRAVDSKGRLRGGTGPDMRVLVDAASPRIAARVWRGGDGEIVCRYAAADDTLRLQSLEFEYRAKGDADWRKIASEPILSRESPAHLVGEEIWWAGEKVESLVVRITITDAAGNKAVQQFTMEPADPGVDQTLLAREIGAPPLPGQAGAGETASPPALAGLPTSTSGEPLLPAPQPPVPGEWPADSSTPWQGDTPAGFSAPPAAGEAGLAGGTLSGGSRSVLARPVGRGVPVAPPSVTPGTSAPAAPSLPSAAPPALDAATAATTVRSLPTEYRGRPLQLVRSRRFTWEYQIETDRPDAGPVRVELWSTRDGGVTWERSAVDDDAQSPIDVTLPASGLYGFRLDIVSDVPGPGGGPRSGEMPEGWIGVDDEPPHVEVIEAVRVQGVEPAAVLIRWVARDQLLVPRSVRLLHSPSPDGPWATIAEALDSQGEYRWQPERGCLPRVYIRAEAADAAGNIGRGTTPEPVTVFVPRVVGKLGGVKLLAPSGSP
ncbi:MAG: hypothetical protein DWH79_03650 [Planctomycetota bacterium]|nr:MAG: hypothetical protein DWH79_03650 [Planctomycetota bacterium]